MRVAAVTVAATTVLIMVVACGGGGNAPGEGDATPGGGTPPGGEAPGRTPLGGGTPSHTPPGAEPGPPIADPSLEGTRWTVDTVITVGAEIPVPAAGPAHSAWLEIGGGTFYAFTGCGEVEGRVRISGGELRFSYVIHAIPVHCPEEFAQADQVMRELLDREARYAVEAGRLRLDHASGIGLRLHAGGSGAPES
jgi:heat shock protein HslJ